MTMMTDSQLVKVFSLKFACEVVASLHCDVMRKTLCPQDIAADLGKLRALVDHFAAAFGDLSAGEQYSCEQAMRRVVDILRYAGQAEEAKQVETRLGRGLANAA